MPGKGEVLFVPMDFTPPLDRYRPPDNGTDALKQDIEIDVTDTLYALLPPSAYYEDGPIADSVHPLILD